MYSFDFTGKTVYVTGGSRGIGAAAVRAFVDAGAKAAVFSRSGAVPESLSDNENVVGVAVDVADFAACEAALKQAEASIGTPDILINAAGITRDGLLVRMSAENFKSVIDTNLCGAFNMLRLAATGMFRRKSGCIVNVSSIVGITGNAGQANYAASKAGVIALTQSAAAELSPRGIRVNAIAPGFIETDMTAVLPGQVKDSILNRVALAAPASPEISPPSASSSRRTPRPISPGRSSGSTAG